MYLYRFLLFILALWTSLAQAPKLLQNGRPWLQSGFSNALFVGLPILAFIILLAQQIFVLPVFRSMFDQIVGVAGIAASHSITTDLEANITSYIPLTDLGTLQYDLSIQLARVSQANSFTSLMSGVIPLMLAGFLIAFELAAIVRLGSMIRDAQATEDADFYNRGNFVSPYTLSRSSSTSSSVYSTDLDEKSFEQQDLHCPEQLQRKSSWSEEPLWRAKSTHATPPLRYSRSIHSEKEDTFTATPPARRFNRSRIDNAHTQHSSETLRTLRRSHVYMLVWTLLGALSLAEIDVIKAVYRADLLAEPNVSLKSCSPFSVT